MTQWVKDLALSLLSMAWSLMRSRFHHWHGNVNMPQAQPNIYVIYMLLYYICYYIIYNIYNIYTHTHTYIYVCVLFLYVCSSFIAYNQRMRCFQELNQSLLLELNMIHFCNCLLDTRNNFIFFVHLEESSM